MASWTQQEINDAYKKIMDKTAKDPEFRKLALENPKKAFSEVSGKEVPENINIRFIENEPGIDQTFVLPNKITEELSDDELDKISGGFSSWGVYGSTGVYKDTDLSKF